MASCGTGTYGDIPTDLTTTQFVNIHYDGTDSDGSEVKPWKTIQQGIDSAAPGAIVAVAEGFYHENVFIYEREVKLWGRCPELVSISGTDAGQSSVQITTDKTNRTEVRGFTIKDSINGIAVQGASDVLISQMWIHHTKNAGLGVIGPGETSVVVSDTLIESARTIGAYVTGSNVTFERVAVVNTQEDPASQYGFGIYIRPDAASERRTQATIRTVLLDQNHQAGMMIVAADATLDSVVVTRTQPIANGQYGVGISIQNETGTDHRAHVTMSTALVYQNHYDGVEIAASDVWLNGVVVRNTMPDNTGHYGRGISIRSDPKAKEQALVTVTGSVVDQNHDTGIFVSGSGVTLEGVRVSSTLPNDVWPFGCGVVARPNHETSMQAHVTVRSSTIINNSQSGISSWGSTVAVESSLISKNASGQNAQYGRGVLIADDPITKQKSDMRMASSVVHENHGIGVKILGSDATLDGVIVSDTQQDNTEESGHGIIITNNSETKEKANVTIYASEIRGNHTAGIHAFGSKITLKDAVVSDTRPNGNKKAGTGIIIESNHQLNFHATADLTNVASVNNHVSGIGVWGSHANIDRARVSGTMASEHSGQFGDGILAISVDNLPATANISRSDISSNARAGVSNYAASIVITRSIFNCNRFDMDGELTGDEHYSYDGSGDNRCGCGARAHRCHVDSAQLESPTLISSPPPTPDPEPEE